MRWLGRPGGMRAPGALALAGCMAVLCLCATGAQALTLHVQHRLETSRGVRLSFTAPALPEGGYYYAVLVLRPYRHFTRAAPPPCSTSSDMQRTDYGWPDASGTVVLRVTPARSHTGHWCPGGVYGGGVYAVPHAPPCNAEYPCSSEPYKQPCAGVGPGCVLGVIALPREWAWPDPLPVPRAAGATMEAHFAVAFPARRRQRH